MSQTIKKGYKSCFKEQEMFSVRWLLPIRDRTHFLKGHMTINPQKDDNYVLFPNRMFRMTFKYIGSKNIDIITK